MALDSEILQCARTLFDHRFREEIRPAYYAHLRETKAKLSVGPEFAFSGVDARRLMAVEVQFAKEAAMAEAESLVKAIGMAGLKFDREALTAGLDNAKALLKYHQHSAARNVCSAFPQNPLDPAVKAGVEQDVQAEMNRIHDSILALLKAKVAEAVLAARATKHGSDDDIFARMAVDEARKSVPESDERPHPKVGAVVVKNGQVLSTAHRGEHPECHAEFIALEKKLPADVIAGATVYTTLEPCTTRNHPKIPCAERLIERKVSRVVIGMLDPDDRISGRGQRRLRKAGIVTEFFPPDLMREVEEMNREFTRFCESKTTIAGSPQHQPRREFWLRFCATTLSYDEHPLQIQNSGDESAFDVLIKIPADGSRFVSDVMTRVDNNREWVECTSENNRVRLESIRRVLVETILSGSEGDNPKRVPVLVSYRSAVLGDCEFLLEIRFPLRNGIQFALPEK